MFQRYDGRGVGHGPAHSEVHASPQTEGVEADDLDTQAATERQDVASQENIDLAITEDDKGDADSGEGEDEDEDDWSDLEEEDDGTYIDVD